jgi:dihydrodipicolinate synthase/N-acetylneuraminate lyase
LVEFVSKNDIQNLFCLGSWGGFALMDDNERKKAKFEIFQNDNLVCVEIQIFYT